MMLMKESSAGSILSRGVLFSLGELKENETIPEALRDRKLIRNEFVHSRCFFD